MGNSNVRFINLPDKVQRERLLEMLLAELDGMVYRCRVDQYWTMEFISDGCLNLTGYKPDDLLMNSHISYEEITYPADRERVRKEIEESVRDNKPFNIQYRITHKDGSIRWVWERGSEIEYGDNSIKVIHGFIHDITNLHKQQEKLAEAEKRYRNIFEYATEGIFQTSKEGYYLEVNPALARIYGYDTPTELINDLRNIKQQLYVDPKRRDEFVQLMRERGSITNFESQIYRRDGSIIWISENARTVYSPDGKLLYYEGTVEDITERKSYETQISHQATHDNLTDLPNRLLLTDRLQQVIQHAIREHYQIAVLFIDLDHFKNINDTMGHAAGDKLIQIIAERLRGCMRDGDTVARIGGDEFVLILPKLQTSSDQISHAVQRILDAIRKPCRIADRDFQISCSIGVSIFPDDGKDVESLLKNADMAMYKSKNAGRNNFKFYTQELNRIVTESIELEQQLRMALNNSEFELHYQPKISILNDEVNGAEALIRWRAPNRGLVSPARFIPLAEDTGLIEQLGAWVLEAACLQNRNWIDCGMSIVPISVNISPRQFRQPRLVDYIKSTINKYQIPPETLILEITETCMAQDLQKFIRILEDIKSLGVLIAIDDFGSGYSNLSHLKIMPADFLKADRSLIKGIEREEKDRAIYRAIVSMAHNLGMKIIAEGVETQVQYDFLRSIEVDEIQGFYFSMPLPAENFIHMLLRTSEKKSA